MTSLELCLTINNHVPEGRKIFFQDLKYKIKMIILILHIKNIYVILSNIL